MENMKSWLNCFDEIKESKIKPFKTHLLSGLLNENELNSYAVLQSAFVLFNGNLSENQERLYKFYLPTLSKEFKLAEIISQAQDINDDKLKEYIKLLEDKGLLFLFLLDVLVFSRLDNSVNEDFKRVLNSFCHSLSIKSDDVNQVVYLSDCILGVEPDEKPELTDVFFNLIKNPIWIEFFARTITQSNIQDIKGGIWCIDEAIELLEGDVLWKNSVIIFEGAGRIDHFNGTFTSEKTSVISPVITVNNVIVDMDTVEIKGEYDSGEKITAFDINASKNVTVKNSKVNTVNARAFSFCQHSVSGRFENTDFTGCGNELLLGGAVKFVEKVYFNNCNFNDCKALVGGALFFRTSHQDNIVDCNFKNCFSNTDWDDGMNAGALYFKSSQSYNMSCIVNCNIQGNISTYTLDSHSSFKQTIVNSYLSGILNYCNYANNCNHMSMLDRESMALSGVNDSTGKNLHSGNVSEYSSLINSHE